MKWWRAVRETPTILTIDALETVFSRSVRISSSLPSSLDFPSDPFGRLRPGSGRDRPPSGGPGSRFLLVGGTIHCKGIDLIPAALANRK
jgi:hypothetical protein